jgi:nucleoid-associated protein YgaU
MTIYKGSRYEYSTIDYVKTNENSGLNPIVFYDFSDLGPVSYYEHTYVQGDRLDTIAHHYYKNPEYWWIIPEYNPEIEDFTNIPAGTVLRIPRV